MTAFNKYSVFPLLQYVCEHHWTQEPKKATIQLGNICFHRCAHTKTPHMKANTHGLNGGCGAHGSIGDSTPNSGCMATCWDSKQIASTIVGESIYLTYINIDKFNGDEISQIVICLNVLKEHINAMQPNKQYDKKNPKIVHYNL